MRRLHRDSPERDLAAGRPSARVWWHHGIIDHHIIDHDVIVGILSTTTGIMASAQMTQFYAPELLPQMLPLRKTEKAQLLGLSLSY